MFPGCDCDPRGLVGWAARAAADGTGSGVGGRLRGEAGGGALGGRQGLGRALGWLGIAGADTVIKADSLGRGTALCGPEVFLWRLHHQYAIAMPISTTPPTAPPMIGKGDIPSSAPLLVADVPAPLLVADVQQYQ